MELPKQFRGTHMSRLVEIVFKWSQKPLGGHDLRLILEQVSEQLNAARAHITIRFKYFLEKQAPVSKSVSALDYDCEFTGTLSDDGFDFILGVEVPITTLCPCSKEISERGAHNQRGVIRARIRYAPRRVLLDRGPGRASSRPSQAATSTLCSSARMRNT